ncbi:MAG: hypothetical protein E7647_06500 [Ruminococcaceae bacterium]|nr:hypothetical protein [Oscillospiraceae bacterium]
MKRKREHLFRYIVIGAFYVIVCLIFVARLINIQIAGQDYYSETYHDGYFYRSVPIQAQRGEIFDRNGNVLVSNTYTYNLYLDAGSLTADQNSRNLFILDLLEKAEALGEYDGFELPDQPFEKKDGKWGFDKVFMATAYGRRFTRLLTDLGFEQDDSEKGGWEKADKEEIRETLLDRYGITDEDGKLRYSEEDCELIFAIRLDMELSYFSTAEPYTLVKDIGIRYITAVTEGTVRGIGISCTASRVYNYPGYASHMLGRTGKIMAEKAEYYTDKGYKLNAIVGTSGVEEAFEDYLHGEDGILTIVEDEYGNVVDTYVSKEPKPGQDVYLTIDINLQIAAENALKSNIELIVANGEADDRELSGEDANAGALSAIEKDTGAVLALASYPTYNLATFNEDYATLREDENSPLFFRALEGTYAPGSTFKPGVAVAALQEGIISPWTEIYTEGQYTFYDDFQPSCWIYSQRYGYGRHGSINVSEAIQVSCNYFFFDIGRQLTISNITKYCKGYGLGQPTGIELPEKTGILAGPAHRESTGNTWYDGDTLAAAIGQSDHLFNPLQISVYVATMLNGGTRYSAHLLHEVREYDGTVVYTAAPEVVDSVPLDATAVSTVKYAMKDVTENGSAARVFVNYPITIGGKTGTAQVTKTASDNALFTAFAPFDDPEIVTTCIIERGANGTDAGFAIRDLFDQYFGLNKDEDPDDGATNGTTDDTTDDTNEDN